MKRLTGEEFLAHREEQIVEAVANLGQVIVGGVVVLAPSAAQVAEYLKVTRSALYHPGSYGQNLENSTGLVVVHDGIVLAESRTTEGLIV